MTWTSSIYNYFDLYLTTMTLNFNLPEKMFQMALLLPRGQQLCKFILKSIHKCTSFGPGQAQYKTILTFIWPLWPGPSTYLKKCFKWNFSSLRTTTVQNYFWNPCITVQVKVRTSSTRISQWTIKSRSRLKIEHRVDLNSSRCMDNPSFMTLALIVSEKMTLMQKLNISQGNLKSMSRLKIERRVDLYSSNCMHDPSFMALSPYSFWENDLNAKTQQKSVNLKK